MRFAELMCKPPQAGDNPVSPTQAELFRQEVPQWALRGSELTREFQFKNFREAMVFVNQVAEVAEAQGHHPDIFISYKIVRLTLTTHKINGLSQNDFIMAARIDQLRER